jgi:Holliday junction resolvase
MKGQKAEQRVTNSLRRAGARVEQSPGSRGSADVIANWPGGKEWMTQVKYSGVGKPAGLSSRERKNLISRADRNNATPVLAQVTPEKIKFFSAKTERKLKP